MAFSPETYGAIKGLGGAAGGFATLDADGKVPEEQLPSGSGMSVETYDPDGAVAEAGGIPAYVEENAPVRSVNEKTGDVVLTPADLGIGTVFNLKGSKTTVTDLPASGNEIGDVWYVVAESVGYIWLNDGTEDRWEPLGLPIDLSAYSTTAQMNAAIAAAIGDAIGGAY